ncbi:MAG: hypothetical protein HY714_04175 [Candidatus Omnitrophica bacterium]|nr:hypothetical protein [Candidatus Omnitrophota bacterium]
MNAYEMWERALKNTQIVRPRIQPLSTYSTTQLPYVFLAESSFHAGDTVVRKGEISVNRPALVLPRNSPLFEGFEFEKFSKLERDFLDSLLLVRGVRFPSLKYQNQTESLDVREEDLGSAVRFFSRLLQQEESVSTGLVVGPEDCWQFSVLIFVSGEVLRSAGSDIRRLTEDAG